MVYGISLCEFLALEICPRLAVFGDVRFDSDLWGRRTPWAVVEVQPVDYFHAFDMRSKMEVSICVLWLQLAISIRILLF